MSHKCDSSTSVFIAFGFITAIRDFNVVNVRWKREGRGGLVSLPFNQCLSIRLNL